MLKRLSQAEADGDPIYAVIRGSGVNYDGKTNGITAPSGVAQMNLLKEVYDQYHIHPEDIEYVVTHGTGTKLGDPVEINALNDAFKAYTKKQGYCALTSAKTNFGHAFAASGLVSLVGLVLSMRHEFIPASLNCERENGYIQWEGSPFYVNKQGKPWLEADGKALTGAVSAFGMSGTNAHLVVQHYRSSGSGVSKERHPYYLLALSAKTGEALEEKNPRYGEGAASQGPSRGRFAAHQLYPAERASSFQPTLRDRREGPRRRCASIAADRGR
ncbi:polyketide synthase [Paenibacillus sp. P26]|nr:polyketide synthase [Paenibacillus sp. P26]